MANATYLIYSGGTVQLQDATNGLDFTYTPMSTSISDEFVTETGRLRVSKSSITDVRTAVQNVSRAINEAQLYNNYSGGTAPVYLYFMPEGYSEAWRSEIITGYIAPQDGNLDRYRWAATGVKDIEFDVELTRRNYFEGPETALTLSNPNGTATTVNIDFLNDGAGTVANRARYNYVDIAGTAVTGELLAPVVVTVTDIEVGAAIDGMRDLNIHVGWSGDYTAKSRYEAEAGYQVVNDGGTAFASTSVSDGTAVTSATYNQHSLTDYAKYAGNLYEVYAYTRGVGTALYDIQILGRVGQQYQAESVNPEIYGETQAGFVQVSDVWSPIDLGGLYLPPIYVGGTAYSNLYLIVLSDVAVEYDVLHVFPMDQRIVASAPYRVQSMVIDTVTGKNYGLGGIQGSFSDAFVRPLSIKGSMGLSPGKNQRVHFIDTYGQSYSTAINANYSVSISYRPRRLTV